VPHARNVSWVWLGVMPFFIFALAFLLLPSWTIVSRSFQGRQGEFTFDNILALFQPNILASYWISIQISAATAVGGGLFGFLLAYAVVMGGLPRFMRSSLMTFSGVASNFAGVPLAFAFIATIGPRGIITLFLRDSLNFNLNEHGFKLLSFWGLSITYMYFQFPLMVLIITPALDGLKREWREASENLGATTFDYWRYVALPILLPSLLGTMILLFGNAFGAYATAYALTGGLFNLITLVLGQQIGGDVLFNPGLGYAMALGMVVVMGISLLGYSWLQRLSERWLQ
jgi:putative spermidine/putrescine transport system permease protein